MTSINPDAVQLRQAVRVLGYTLRVVRKSNGSIRSFSVIRGAHGGWFVRFGGGGGGRRVKK